MIFSPIIHCSALDYVTPLELKEMGFNTITVSILNLLQRPGWEWLAQHGGLHAFLGWKGTILSDMSVGTENDLVEITKQNENSLKLRSKIDGQKISLDLSNFDEIKTQLGIENLAVEMRYLRNDSADFCFNEQFKSRNVIVSSAAPQLFARHGKLFTSKGILQIQQADYTLAFSPVEEKCDCYTCRHFTRAYLRHLYLNSEMLAIRLMTIHNILFLRKKIEEELQ